MTIKLEMLRCFVAVARDGQLTSASASLHRTPSAVSMTLKQLEEALGAPLFESERKNRLTPLGRFVLAEAERELAHFQRSLDAMHGYARAETGLVRLAVVPSAAIHLLPRAVQRFREGHPGVHLEIRDMDSASIRRELLAERVDLGIGSGAGGDNRLHRELLFSDHFGLVCHRDHPWNQRGDPPRWEDLAGETFIGNPLCALLTLPPVQTALAATRLRMYNTTSLLAMVRAGLGVTVLPELSVAVPDPGLCFLVPAGKPQRRELHLISLAGAAPGPACEALGAALLENSTI